MSNHSMGKMLKYILPLVLLFSSCTAAKSQPISAAFFSQGDRKLKQKAVVLQKKLDKAQHTLSEEQQAIERLRLQLCDAQLKAIEAKVEIFEKKWRSDPARMMQSLHKEISNVFMEDRETLIHILQVGPDTVRAQVLLDRILHLITQLSDSAPVLG